MGWLSDLFRRSPQAPPKEFTTSSKIYPVEALAVPAVKYELQSLSTLRIIMRPDKQWFTIAGERSEFRRAARALTDAYLALRIHRPYRQRRDW